MPVRIGITTSFEEQEQRLHHSYVQAIERAGGLPVIVPMLREAASLEALATSLDALVLPGGPAVTDGMIGTLPEDISPTPPLRLATDIRILEAFLAAHKPILGICYGMQLMNAHAGGTIYADVECQRENILVHSQKRGADTHPIQVMRGSHLHAVLQQSEIEVNTRHIQAIATPGAGFRVVATAPDGVIEAIENEDGSLLGVQFHPERMGMAMEPLFKHLVASARSRRTARNNLLTVPL